MLKKYLPISFILFAFGLLLSHELVPHHHHEGSEIAAHEQQHGHDHGEGEHSHHLFDLLFSIMHRADVEEIVLTNHTIDKVLFNIDLPLSILAYSCTLEEYLKFPIQHIENDRILQEEKAFLRSLRFRGPPVV